MSVSPEPQVDTSSAIVLAGYLARRGVERAEFLREAGLRPGDIEPNARISRSSNRRLWEAAIRRTRDPAFGIHLAAYAQPGAMGLAEYVARTAKNLVEAGQQYARLVRMTHDSVLFEVEEVGDRVRFIHRMADGQRQPPEVVDFLAGRLTVIEREITGEPAGIRAVHLSRPRPENPLEWQRFFRARLEFDAESIRLEVDAEQAYAPLPRADPRLHQLLRRQAEAALAELPSIDSFASHARAVLRETLATASGRADEVARRLGISERSLRRRLAASGMSHSALLDNVRQQLAFELETRRVGTQLEIAIELGYASAAAYRRAFRRWTGHSPAAWRRSNARR